MANDVPLTIASLSLQKNIWTHLKSTLFQVEVWDSWGARDRFWGSVTADPSPFCFSFSFLQIGNNISVAICTKLEHEGDREGPPLSPSCHVNTCSDQLWKSSGSCKTSLWIFLLSEVLPLQTFKGSHNLFTALSCSTCVLPRVCAHLSACFRKQGRVLFGWKSRLFHMEPGQSRICILCTCLAPWHCLGKRKEPETACRAGQKGVRGDCLASPGMRVVDTVLHHLWLISIPRMKKAWKVGDFPMK